MAAPDSPTIKTWNDLKGPERAIFYAAVDSPERLKILFERYKLVGVDAIAIKEFHKRETESEERSEHDEPEHHTSLFGHGSDHGGGHGEHKKFQPDMLTEEMQNDETYKKIHEKIKDKKKDGWYGKNGKPGKKRLEAIKEWQRTNRKNIDCKEGNEFLKNHPDNPESYAVRKIAETKFRKKNKELARDYDKKEIERTDAGEVSKDFIGKQYLKEADHRAELRTEKLRKKLEKLEKKKNKLAPNEYQERLGKIQEKINKIREKEDKNHRKAFARRFKKKADIYAQTNIKQKEANLAVGADIAAKKYRQERKIPKNQARRNKNKSKKSKGKKQQSNKGGALILPHKNVFFDENRTDEKLKEKKQSRFDQLREKIQQSNKIADWLEKFKQSEAQPKFEADSSTQEFAREGNFNAFDANPVGESLSELAPATEMASAGAEAAAGGAGAAAGGSAAAATAVGGEAAVAAGATAPAWVPVVLIIIGILLLVALIIIIILGIKNAGQQNAPTYVKVACSDEPGFVAKEGLGSPQMTAKFGIAFLNNGDVGLPQKSWPSYQGALNTQQKLYDDLCRLFGHVNGNTTDNTFGQIFRGRNHQYDALSLSTNVVELLYLSGDQTNDSSINSHPDCSIVLDTRLTPKMNLLFYKPDKCKSDEQLEFTFDRYLALVLIDRANASTGTNTATKLNDNQLFSTFKTTVLNTGKLPTADCQNSNPTDKNCFADMVAEYMIYLPVAANMCTSGNGKNIVWLDSYSQTQFNPHFPDWVWSQCSQSSLAEVLNAYKSPTDPNQYKVVDLETYALSIGVWDPTNGFLGPFQPNWTKEAAHYGFSVDYKQYPITPASLDTIVNIANQGHPVIVGAPGHYLVLWGGDTQYVFLMDSSGHDFTWAPNHQKYKMNRNNFLYGGLGGDIEDSYWNGLAIVASPTNTSSVTTTTTTGGSCQLPPGKNSLSDVATQIVNAITANSQCKVLNTKIPPYKSIYGGSNYKGTQPSDVSCLDSNNPPIQADAKQILVDGVNKASNGFLQCDDFVRAVAAAAGAPFSLNTGVARNYRGTGTAHGIPSCLPGETCGVPSGYTWVDKDQENTTPMKPGDIAIWGTLSTWGHIGIVTAVNPPYFTVAEANGDGFGSVDISPQGHYSIDDPTFSGWLVKQ